MEGRHINKKGAVSARKTYSPPKLESYGNLRSVTEATYSNPGRKDSPTSPNFRT